MGNYVWYESRVSIVSNVSVSVLIDGGCFDVLIAIVNYTCSSSCSCIMYTMRYALKGQF